MAHYVLTNAKVWVDGYDFSGDANALVINYSADEIEDTNFGDTTHVFLGGLQNFDAQFEGGVDLGAAKVEGINFANVGTTNTPVSFGIETGADGEIAYTFQALTSKFDWGAKIGELQRYSAGFAASGNRLVRGTVMHNATRTSSGNGTARQLGLVAAGQKLYASLHVLATVSGTSPTLDVIIQSDDNSGMTSATNRITFSQEAAIGSQFATPVSGAIANDDYWRVNYTIGGTSTPTFPFVVIIGIV